MSELKSWLALAIGNSRLHWAHFLGDRLQQTWHTPHFTPELVQQIINHLLNGSALEKPIVQQEWPISWECQPTELWIASVVPEQTQLWQTYPAAHLITLNQIPLSGKYPMLGIDRALALWGAIQTIGSPVLVIDGGTALTFTGAAADRLIGGAILPGLRLQFQALNQQTAALPFVDPAHQLLPSRWANNTDEAISSGILYTVLAGIQSFMQAWWQDFPNSRIVLTGGDGDRLFHSLTALAPDLANHLILKPNLVFAGMQAIVTNSV